MSAQSGIGVSDELAQAFTDAQQSEVRVLKVVIDNERLMPSSTLPMTGSDIEDFDSIPALLDPPDTAAYILVKLDSSSNDDSGREWVLATYVPDRAAVRSKMLYSSTKASLVRQLGEGRFKHTIFASSPEELSREGYKRFIKHHESSAPMTAREQEMDDIKKAEGTEVLGGSARRSHAGSSLGMEWDEDVEQAFEELAKGEKRIVQLAIDTQKERIVLLSTQDTLSLPANDPCYTFYKHATGYVFIYCCPDTSAVRSRMIYSSNAQPIVQDAKKRGIEIVKKLETSTPSDITEAYIDAECKPEGETSTEAKTGFARPSRPGRKR